MSVSPSHRPAPLPTLNPATSPLRLTIGRWLGIYPCITALVALVGSRLLGHYPTPLVTLLLTALLVPLTHYLVFPLIERLSGGWVRFPSLHGAAHHRVAVVVWAVTWPLITVVLMGVLAAFRGQHLPVPLLTLIVTLIAVPLQSLLLLPAIMPRARGWIMQGP